LLLYCESFSPSWIWIHPLKSGSNRLKSMQIHVTFWHGQLVQPGLDGTGGVSAHICWPAGCSWHLASTRGGDKIFRRTPSDEYKGVSHCGHCEAKTVRRCFTALDLYNLYFVGAYILLPLIV
jgi:hypothetical protein